MLFGFGVVLVLWLASVYYFTLRFAEIETLSAERGQPFVLTVRVPVLLGPIYIRDALDETDANTKI